MRGGLQDVGQDEPERPDNRQQLGPLGHANLVGEVQADPDQQRRHHRGDQPGGKIADIEIEGALLARSAPVARHHADQVDQRQPGFLPRPLQPAAAGLLPGEPARHGHRNAERPGQHRRLDPAPYGGNRKIVHAVRRTRSGRPSLRPMARQVEAGAPGAQQKSGAADRESEIPRPVGHADSPDQGAIEDRHQHRENEDRPKGEPVDQHVAQVQHDSGPAILRQQARPGRKVVGVFAQRLHGGGGFLLAQQRLGRGDVALLFLYQRLQPAAGEAAPAGTTPSEKAALRMPPPDRHSADCRFAAAIRR